MDKFVYRGIEYPIEIGYKRSTLEFPEKFGLRLNSIFKEPETIQALLLDDDLMIKIWYYYVNLHTGNQFEDALDELKEKDFHHFRESFFNAVINFTPPHGRDSLREAWLLMKKELKNLVKSSWKDSSLDSSPEQA